MTNNRHDRLTVLLHWTMALLILAQLALGLWMVGLPKDDSGLRANWFNVHKSLGLVLLALIALRGLNLLRRPRIDPAPGQPGPQRAAIAVHHALYLLMAIVPLSGLLGSAWSKYPIRFLSWTLPRLAEPWDQGKAAMATLHLFSTWALIALVVLHVLAFAFHQYVLRDRLLDRMR